MKFWIGSGNPIWVSGLGTNGERRAVGRRGAPALLADLVSSVLGCQEEIVRSTKNSSLGEGEPTKNRPGRQRKLASPRKNRNPMRNKPCKKLNTKQPPQGALRACDGRPGSFESRLPERRKEET